MRCFLGVKREGIGRESEKVTEGDSALDRTERSSIIEIALPGRLLVSCVQFVCQREWQGLLIIAAGIGGRLLSRKRSVDQLRGRNRQRMSASPQPGIRPTSHDGVTRNDNQAFRLLLFSSNNPLHHHGAAVSVRKHLRVFATQNNIIAAEPGPLDKPLRGC